MHENSIKDYETEIILADRKLKALQVEFEAYKQIYEELYTVLNDSIIGIGEKRAVQRAITDAFQSWEEENR